MKLLLDMNLPPSLAATLRSAGFTAVHWSEIGDPRAADTLADGALVTVSQSESRVSILPLRRSREMQRTLITIGLLWPWLTKFGLGRLAGDLRIDKPGFTVYAPFTTMIIVSLVVSLMLWMLRR